MHPDLSGPQDLVTGLWQEIPFARLPPDAPPELDRYVQDIDSPRRVYAVHRASRRHDFQSLVSSYVFQLRAGCGSTCCTTSTCFTRRQRLAGKAPIRRYNATSARTLAIYLASRDNPRSGLCPYLRVPTQSSSAVNTLILTARPQPPMAVGAGHVPSRSTVSTKMSHNPRPTSSPPQRPSSVSIPRSAGIDDISRATSPVPGSHDSQPDRMAKSGFQVAEQAESRDHRSFAASTFSTVAFKMLEWLAPGSVETLVGRLHELNPPSPDNTKLEGVSPPDRPSSASTESTAPRPTGLHALSRKMERPDKVKSPRRSDVTLENLSDYQAQPAKRNPESTVRTSSIFETKKRGSPDSSALSPGQDDLKAIPRSHRKNGHSHDKIQRSHRPGALHPVSAVPEVPSGPAFFEGVPPPASVAGPRVDGPVTQPGETRSCPRRPSSAAASMEDETRMLNGSTPSNNLSETSLDIRGPQFLNRLDPLVVNFICDTFLEDGTSEPYNLASGSGCPYPEPLNQPQKLRRRRRFSKPVGKMQWKAFHEQTIFRVLSDPQTLVESFTDNGKLYDSHTLWYCLMRLTRATPNLVFHSLWMAAESIFQPPSKTRSLHSAGPGQEPKSREAFSSLDVGRVMSICLHALVASVPILPDSRTLYELSRVRSHGIAFSGGVSMPRQPASICLAYDDAFSNDLAMRLARRLFSGLTARNGWDELASLEADGANRIEGSSVLGQLLDQLDLLSAASSPTLEFSPAERLLHETRVPTLLLDWARAVILDDWDGDPVFAATGPLAGALSLITAMYEKRNSLLLGDIQFRLNYLSERLDSIETPVEWLRFTSSRQRHHLLDYPFIFTPNTLVSFFRSINFSRMSRTYEESSSLKTRMSAIIDPGSLITNHHHKVILQDLLKTASSKFLILEIGRENVLADAFDQLWRREERELLRPLKIHLGEDGGEEGFDSGGVQQEFFRMAIAECLDPRYGAFTVDERTRMAWFVPGSIVENWKFELIGLLVSLAVYNGLTLPVTFPRALYRRLLGLPVKELHHIADGWPDLASGLMALVEWDERDGLIEDIFARTYEFSVSTFGSNVSRQMLKVNPSWPQTLCEAAKSPDSSEDSGDAPMVTNSNRDDYVSDYIRYLTDVSVRPQFAAFERGFRKCMSPKALGLLNPPILQSLVEGIQDIDIAELRRHTRYVGWDASHRTIRDFWSVVRKYDDSMKRKLLEFVTASDRVPVGGMRNLQFVVQKNGTDEGEGGHLPTAYTCFGTLLLPEYKSRDALRERLGMALENSQGFGFP